MSWRRKQSEHKVVGHCGTVFDSLQNIPEKSELQSHIFKLEKAVQQIYTLRAEGNAKVFQTCSQVVSELETACTLFELEPPAHFRTPGPRRSTCPPLRELTYSLLLASHPALAGLAASEDSGEHARHCKPEKAYTQHLAF